MTITRSTYDDIHDKYDAIDTTKRGTRYERLVAMVQKALDETAGVVHDLKLVGEDTQVKHQIDVTITRGGEARRVLIECKDYDVSGEPVGLRTIRDFYGVVDDVRPDEAIVITCNRFTDEAMQYAKGKNIKLAILRSHRPEDDEGTIKEVHILSEISIPIEFRASIVFVDDAGLRAYWRDVADDGKTLVEHADRAADTYFHNENGERVQLVNAINKLTGDPRFRPETVLEDGRREKTITLNGCGVQRGDGPVVPIQGFKVSFSLHVDRRQLQIKAPLVELILTPIGEGSDLLIHEQTLRRFTIDANTSEVRVVASTR